MGEDGDYYSDFDAQADEGYDYDYGYSAKHVFESDDNDYYSAQYGDYDDEINVDNAQRTFEYQADDDDAHFRDVSDGSTAYVNIEYDQYDENGQSIIDGD